MEIVLSNTDHDAVITDIKKLIPGWQPNRLSPVIGFSFVRLDDDIITPAEYDEQGNETTPAEMSGKLKYWVHNDDVFDTSELTTIDTTPLKILY